jgi:hypothetical protein
VRCRTARSDEASASTLLGDVEFRDDRAVIGQAVNGQVAIFEIDSTGTYVLGCFDDWRVPLHPAD